MFAAIENFFTAVISNLFRYRMFCPSFFFRAQQEFDFPVSYKVGSPKVSTSTTVHVPIRFTWESEKQQNFCHGRIFSRQNFVLSTNQVLKIAHFHFGWCTNWKLTVKFCSVTASWKRRRSIHLLFLLDAAGVFLTLVLNQNAWAKKRGNWVLFKLWLAVVAME